MLDRNPNCNEKLRKNFDHKDSKNSALNVKDDFLQQQIMTFVCLLKTNVFVLINFKSNTKEIFEKLIKDF